MAKQQAAERWVELSREWIPKTFAVPLTGVSRQAITKAIASKRLRERHERFGDASFSFVNLEDLAKIGGSRD